MLGKVAGLKSLKLNEKLHPLLLSQCAVGFNIPFYTIKSGKIRDKYKKKADLRKLFYHV